MSLKQLPMIEASQFRAYARGDEPQIKAYDKWNKALVSAKSDSSTITILDVIGEDYWTGGGVTAKRIEAALRSIGNKDITVDINSPGGDFFEGIAIYNLLRAHQAKVTVRVLGLAASAASLIAMAGDEVQIGKAAFLMVHNAWVVAAGNRHDLAQAASMMLPFDEAMAGLYAERAGVDVKTAASWMDGETWFNGTQAVDKGLADDFLPADVVAEDKDKDTKAFQALKRMEASLTKSGMSRSQARSLIKDFQSGMSDSATPSMSDSAGSDMSDSVDVTTGLNKLLSVLKT